MPLLLRRFALGAEVDQCVFRGIAPDDAAAEILVAGKGKLTLPHLGRGLGFGEANKPVGNLHLQLGHRQVMRRAGGALLGRRVESALKAVECAVLSGDSAQQCDDNKKEFGEMGCLGDVHGTSVAQSTYRRLTKKRLATLKAFAS